jgi:hypothetical protein
VPQALSALDPFAIALWTLVLCGIIFMIYLTLALGRFLRAVDDVRQRFDLLAEQLGGAARSAEAALGAKAPASEPLPPPPTTRPAAPPPLGPAQAATVPASPAPGGDGSP